MIRQNKKITFFILAIAVLSVIESAHAGNKTRIPGPIKIACVGNSITYGSGVANREQNAYPKQLQNLLGDHYRVKNFGVSGSTLLKKGDHPYWASEKYQEALNFTPDLIYIKLGTNDSKSRNRPYLDSDFSKDYKALIQSFRDRNDAVRVVLLLPVPSFSTDSSGIWNPVIQNKIIPLIQKVAFDTQSEIIDLHQLFVGDPTLFPDAIHPSSLGAARMARRIYEDVVLGSDKTMGTTDLANRSAEQHNFYGFAQIDFEYNKIHCKIVRPKRVAKGKPWVLRARFFGHEPQLDIALLERGFHIAYCDVSNLFGNEEAVERWNRFHTLMVQKGFSEKVVLEAMSRGGLIAYNWAAQNPEKVACLYADAPVLDGLSWPGGKGEGTGSSADWERFKKVYNIISEHGAEQFKGNPIHKIEAIAKGGYPLLHVCGETDKVVPVNENTGPFAQKIKEAGGTIETIYKPGIGHHPHSLQNPRPIVDFILRATGRKINFATIPAPGAEYRPGAGWHEGKDWWHQMGAIDSLCRTTKDIDLLLIGNSITQGWGGTRPFLTYSPGQTAANAHFEDLNYVNAGISGDRTEHILWRIEHGHYDQNKPKLVTLAIGVNNFAFHTADEITTGIIKIVELMEKTFPDSKILLFGPLPTGLDKGSEARKKYNAVHKTIKVLANKESLYYLNGIEHFTDKTGNLNEAFYGEDGIHLKPEGYEVWGKLIRETYDGSIKTSMD